MGRRSRKRRSGPTPSPAAAARADAAAPGGPDGEAGRRARGDRPRPDRRRAAGRPGERPAAPQPPWGAFPLVELCVLAAIGLGVAGFVVGGRSGNGLLVGAVLLGSVAGLEVAIREHLAGYRSHTLLLASTLAAVTLALSLVARIDRGTIVPAAVAVFAVAFVGLRRRFKRRSGGVGMRVR